MNRIQLLDHSAFNTPCDQNHRQDTKLGNSHTDDLQHCLFVPLHYEPNYAYPLLVWLHGPYDDQRQLNQIMPHVSMRNYVAIAPNGASSLADPGSPPWQQRPRDVMEALDRVVECIELCSTRFNIARARVLLAGFDCGGTMALRLALANPDLVAGVASLGGPVPKGSNPLANLNALRKLPLLISYGVESEDYSTSSVCRDLRLLHTAGMSVTMRQYPCGHEVTTRMLSDLDSWTMQIVTGVDSSAQTRTYLPLDGRN